MDIHPSGTVTFLFTDIEGSTKLWEQHREAMQAALARHDAIMRHAIESNDGYLVKTTGDGMHAAFANPIDAIVACLAAQLALKAQTWGKTAIKSRMGLHSGVAEQRGGDYYGPALNRATRLMAAGYGGQILLSLATEELVRDHLPANVALRDLGEHRLKDLTRPEHIFQLIAPDLRSDFPALKTLDTFPNNLPLQLTSFVGREHEIEEVKRLFANNRLLTLTGSGGCGKTRLATQVAMEMLDAFKDGIWFIELAPLADPALIPQTVVSILGLQPEGERPLMTVLTEFLRARSAFLILDNCEHMIADCAKFANTILHAAPNVKILASSREALGVVGETVYRVPSLGVPDPKNLPPLESLTQYDAVRLFIDRVLAVSNSFTVTNANAPAVAQICSRLDGIPLALELAAARVKGMRVEQIAQKLDDRFRLLTGGSRTALPRQQTLRAAIDWSYSLLSEPERALLRRLSVFVGGWTIEATEAVVGQDGTQSVSNDVLDLLLHLVDKSLVVLDEQSDETRYRMLETIRQYAREKLLDSDEGEAVRTRHRDWFLSFAEMVSPLLFGPDEVLWLNRLETEHDNLRAALEWSFGRWEAETAARLAIALTSLWNRHSHFTEARYWLEAIIARNADLPKSLMARLTSEAGWNVTRQSDFAKARALGETSLSLARELGDKRAIVRALRTLSWTAISEGDLEQARKLIENGLTIAREIGDQTVLAIQLEELATVDFGVGEYTTSISRLEESFELIKNSGGLGRIAFNRLYIGFSYAFNGDYERSESLFKESLLFFQKLGNRNSIVPGLYGLACVCIAWKQPLRAARLIATSVAVSTSIGVSPSLGMRKIFRYDEMLSAARAQVDEALFNAAWNEGSRMTLEQAIEYALEESK